MGRAGTRTGNPNPNPNPRLPVPGTTHPEWSHSATGGRKKIGDHRPPLFGAGGDRSGPIRGRFNRFWNLGGRPPGAKS